MIWNIYFKGEISQCDCVQHTAIQVVERKEVSQKQSEPQWNYERRIEKLRREQRINPNINVSIHYSFNNQYDSNLRFLHKIIWGETRDILASYQKMVYTQWKNKVQIRYSFYRVPQVEAGYCTQMDHNSPPSTDKKTVE